MITAEFIEISNPIGFGFEISGFGFKVSGLVLRVREFGFEVSGFGFEVSGFVFRIQGCGFGVSGSRFRGSISTWEITAGFSVQGLGAQLMLEPLFLSIVSETLRGRKGGQSDRVNSGLVKS